MSRLHSSRVLAVGLVVLALSSAISPSALAARAGDGGIGTTAANGERLQAIRSRTDVAVRERVARLEHLEERVRSAKYLTPSHRSALLTEIEGLSGGLQDVNSTVQNATDVDEARAAARRVVTEHLVYVLEVPKVNEVIALDAVDAAVNQLESSSKTLDEALDALQASGKDVSKERATSTSIDSKIAALRDSVANQSDQVLALQVDGYPANRATLQSVRTSLQGSRQALRSVVDEIRALQQSLR